MLLTVSMVALAGIVVGAASYVRTQKLSSSYDHAMKSELEQKGLAYGQTSQALINLSRALLRPHSKRFSPELLLIPPASSRRSTPIRPVTSRTRPSAIRRGCATRVAAPDIRSSFVSTCLANASRPATAALHLS